MNASEHELSQVAVIIPAYNEDESLPLVLNGLPAVGRVVVVDNGSTDATHDAALACGAEVVMEMRRGYGSACLAGLKSIENAVKSGGQAPRVVVFLDADFSDHPELLPKLVAPILDGRARFVLGSRLLGSRDSGSMTLASIWGNRLACWLMRRFWNVRYTDLGPFRAVDYPSLCSLDMRDVGFGWTIEMQIKAAVAELRTIELPTPYRHRIGVSKISGTWMGAIQAGGKILYTIAKYRWLLGRKTATAITEPE